MTFQSLLPGLASPLRRAVEEASAGVFDIEFFIRSLDDADTAPEAFVPFLAWGFSTDLWDRNWPMAQKRAVAKAWFRLHRKKGTLAGITEAVRIFGGTIAAVRRPPDIPFPEPSLTKAERETYLARFPQIRFYDFRSAGKAGYGAYTSKGYPFPFVSDAAARIGRRAFLYEPQTGEESALTRVDRTVTETVAEPVDFEEVALKGKAGAATFLGAGPKARLFTADNGADSRLYRVTLNAQFVEETSTYHLTTIIPTADPINVNPRRISTPGQKVAGQIFLTRGVVTGTRDGATRTFLPPSTANLRIYDQIFLLDKSRQPTGRRARTFVGNIRLGMPAFNAQLTIETRAKVSRFAAQRFVHGYLVASDKTRLTRIQDAVKVSKSVRDTVVMTTRTMRPARVGDGYKVGTINVNAWVRDL